MTSPSTIPTVRELQVAQDLRFQNRMWRVQRVGWVVLAAVVAMAMLGLLGDGPLSEASAHASDDLEVRYGWVERHRSPSSLVIWVSTDNAEKGKVEVWLNRDFTDALRIEGVTPEPESVETGASRVTYTFEVDESEGRARISFDVMHQGVGSQQGEVGIAQGPSVSFRQFVLP